MKEHREIKIIGIVVIVLLISVVLGSIYLNRQGETEAQQTALKNALEETREIMKDRFDPVLVDLVELEEWEEVSNSRDEIHYRVSLSFPNVKAGYDQLYQRLLEEEPWRSDDVAMTIENIEVGYSLAPGLYTLNYEIEEVEEGMFAVRGYEVEEVSE